MVRSLAPAPPGMARANSAAETTTDVATRIRASYVMTPSGSSGRRSALDVDEIGTEVGMRRQPRRRPADRFLVLPVDVAIDRTLEPAQHRRGHVEALAKPHPGPVRAEPLQRRRARQARA